VNEDEFKIQVFETAPQWSSGLWQRLKLDAGGISLFANSAFDAWFAVGAWREEVGDIVADECGQIYWTAFESAETAQERRRTWSLFRYNPVIGQVERLLDFGACGELESQKLWMRPDYLWVLDHSDTDRKRVLAMSRESFQIVYEIDLTDRDLELGDIDLDRRGIFYALIERQGEKRICPYSTPPRGRSDCFTLKEWREPVALAAAPSGTLYVLDAGLGRFIRFDPMDQARREDLLGSPAENLLKGFVPSLMEVDERGVIYLASNATENAPAKLHLFDRDGSYLGETTRNAAGEIISWNGIPLPKQGDQAVQQIGGIGFDGQGGVYLATDLGLARFSLTTTPIGQDGVYYSKTLDNGNHEGLWHRIAMRGLLPDKTSVEIYYHASDDALLRAAYDQALSADESVEERVAAVEKLMQPRWRGPEIFKGLAGRAEAAPDMLLLENKGRHLWLKLRLLTFDSANRPSIRAARIYYPRRSYLRYLPPVYREDPVSAAFLERFLSLFETIFQGLEQEINQLHRYFDPELAPGEFLPWLASWVNLSVEEDLPVDRVRRLIRRSPDLYGRKGTPAALLEFLEIYTGRPVSLTEHARGLKPLVLGSEEFRLGRKMVLLGSGIKGFQVGDTSVVGYSALRDRVRDPDEPFLPVLRRFTVTVAMDRDEFNRRAATLRRILDEQKPAHTACTIRLMADQNAVGSAILGVGASVTGTQPYQIGITPLGSGFAIAKAPEILRLERGAWVGKHLGL
jgi:phage tail-like protein